jgi:hypothetical protein
MFGWTVKVLQNKNSKLYSAWIRVQGVQRHVGTFVNEDDAHAAVENKIKQLKAGAKVQF